MSSLEMNRIATRFGLALIVAVAFLLHMCVSPVHAQPSKQPSGEPRLLAPVMPRPDAAQDGALHNDFAPQYCARVESYQKAQEVAQVSR